MSEKCLACGLTQDDFLSLAGLCHRCHDTVFIIRKREQERRELDELWGGAITELAKGFTTTEGD
jgi:hypothetical protein